MNAIKKILKKIPNKISFLKRFYFHLLFLPCFLLCCFTHNVNAELRVEISGDGANVLPLTVVPFAGELDSKVAMIARQDLAKSGIFNVIESPAIPPTTGNEWANLGIKYIVSSIAKPQPNGILLEVHLNDSQKPASSENVGNMGVLKVVVHTQNARYIGHKIADFIYERVMNIAGVFSHRIAYIAKTQTENADGFYRYELHVADGDGAQAQPAIISKEPIISPSWSPDNQKLAYVSFENKKPVIYVHDLKTGTRIPVANFKGSNSAPSWSPDGKQLAVVLTKDGNSQIYLMNADGSHARRLMKNTSIDTEPAFSPDGKFIYFSSDRSGGVHVYRIPVTNNPNDVEQSVDAQRLTFNSDYNISPRVSPNGRMLAYISKQNGHYHVTVQDLQTGTLQILTESKQDESPSFSANSQYILYATKAHDSNTSWLSMVSLDGKVRQKLFPVKGEIQEPTWGSK